MITFEWAILNYKFSRDVLPQTEQSKTKYRAHSTEWAFSIQVNAGKNGLWAKLSFWYEKIMSYLVISGRPSSQHKKEAKTKHWEDD